MHLFEGFWSFQSLWILSIGLQCAFWLRMKQGYSKARATAQRVTKNNHKPLPASVIVAVKNGEATILELLSGLQQQDCSHFEVILVDDHSSDQTVDLVEDRIKHDPRFSLVLSSGKGKKAALETGIGLAKHEICLFTDADCVVPSTWLTRHIAYYEPGKTSAVVGFAPLRRANGWLGLVQRYDVEFSQFFGASAIGHSKAFMATGRNLSYSRELFLRVGGFSRHGHTLSGDDDLFVQDIRTLTDTSIYWDDSPEIAVECEPQTNWRDWYRQKIRHSSDARLFVVDVKFGQTLFYLTFMTVWFAGFFELGYAVTGWTMLLAVQFFSMWDAHHFFGHRFSKWWLPFLSAWFAFYSLLVPIVGFIRPPSKWTLK